MNEQRFHVWIVFGLLDAIEFHPQVLALVAENRFLWRRLVEIARQFDMGDNAIVLVFFFFFPVVRREQWASDQQQDGSSNQLTQVHKKPPQGDCEIGFNDTFKESIARLLY